ncbi:MAG: NADH-quinone oxidoreductase subunit C [Candidatus Bathyarchaeia archaeon]
MSGKDEMATDAVEGLKSAIGEANLLGVQARKKRRVFVTVKDEALKPAVTYLAGAGFMHITTITGLDLGDRLEVVYHLDKDGVQLSLRTTVPENRPVLKSITDVLPGAVFYEREVHDLLGVVFEGHPDLSPLVLPEGWPKGLHPLRKKYTVEDIRRMVDQNVSV